MSVFKKLERTRLYEMVAEEIEKAILDGDYEVGSRLPSEQNLADQFEVSRNVVREALKVLQERGLVQVLDGSGAFVAHPNSEQTTIALGRYIRLIGASSAIDALYETRISLEGFNARLAAQRATAEQIKELESYLDLMRANIKSHETWTEADLDFHVSVARATNNPFQAMLLEPLVEQLREVISEGFAKPGASHDGLTAHEKLMECIKEHDPEGAYQTMVEHLLHSERMVKENLQNKRQD
jgi:GntR family transcriptional regulator, transcriptional repressor for pyruvate dehydrogenase complex